MSPTREKARENVNGKGSGRGIVNGTETETIRWKMTVLGYLGYETCSTSSNQMDLLKSHALLQSSFVFTLSFYAE
jgi:hypothetical protein